MPGRPLVGAAGFERGSTPLATLVFAGRVEWGKRETTDHVVGQSVAGHFTCPAGQTGRGFVVPLFSERGEHCGLLWGELRSKTLGSWEDGGARRCAVICLSEPAGSGQPERLIARFPPPPF